MNVKRSKEGQNITKNSPSIQVTYYHHAFQLIIFTPTLGF